MSTSSAACGGGGGGGCVNRGGVSISVSGSAVVSLGVAGGGSRRLRFNARAVTRENGRPYDSRPGNGAKRPTINLKTRRPPRGLAEKQRTTTTALDTKAGYRPGRSNAPLGLDNDSSPSQSSPCGVRRVSQRTNPAHRWGRATAAWAVPTGGSARTRFPIDSSSGRNPRTSRRHRQRGDGFGSRHCRRAR